MGTRSIKEKLYPSVASVNKTKENRLLFVFFTCSGGKAFFEMLGFSGKNWAYSQTHTRETDFFVHLSLNYKTELYGKY